MLMTGAVHDQPTRRPLPRRWRATAITVSSPFLRTQPLRRRKREGSGCRRRFSHGHRSGGGTSACFARAVEAPDQPIWLSGLVRWRMMHGYRDQSPSASTCPRRRVLLEHHSHHGGRSLLQSNDLDLEPFTREGPAGVIDGQASDVWDVRLAPRPRPALPALPEVDRQNVRQPIRISSTSQIVIRWPRNHSDDTRHRQPLRHAAPSPVTQVAFRVGGLEGSRVEPISEVAPGRSSSGPPRAMSWRPLNTPRE